MALRQASAERGGSREATAGTDPAGCGSIVEVPRSFLFVLKAGFSRWRRPALKPLFAGRPHRGMECRQPRTPKKATPRATPVSELLYARTAGDVDAFEG